LPFPWESDLSVGRSLLRSLLRASGRRERPSRRCLLGLPVSPHSPRQGTYGAMHAMILANPRTSFLPARLDFMIGQVSPKAFETIGWRYYVVFCILSFTNAIAMWALIPEVVGKFSFLHKKRYAMASSCSLSRPSLLQVEIWNPSTNFCEKNPGSSPVRLRSGRKSRVPTSRTRSGMENILHRQPSWMGWSTTRRRRGLLWSSTSKLVSRSRYVTL
jgi:hypothetical protein